MKMRGPPRPELAGVSAVVSAFAPPAGVPAVSAFAPTALLSSAMPFCSRAHQR
jgi:hypothetical protein